MTKISHMHYDIFHAERHPGPACDKRVLEWQREYKTQTGVRIWKQKHPGADIWVRVWGWNGTKVIDVWQADWHHDEVTDFVTDGYDPATSEVIVWATAYTAGYTQAQIDELFETSGDPRRKESHNGQK